MFCRNCGTEVSDSAIYCPNCGTEMRGGESFYSSEPENTGTSEVRQRFIDTFKDPLFLVATILLTVSIFFNFNILTLIGVIFFWMIYSGAANKELKIGQLKNVKTLLSVQYAFQIVATVLIGMGIAILVVIRPFLENDEVQKYISELMNGDTATLNALYVAQTTLITTLITSLVVTILGIVAFNCFKKFADEMYANAVSDRIYLPNLKTARTWCIIYGVVLAASFFFNSAADKFNLRTIIAAGTVGGAYIVMSVLLDKQFGKENY